MTRSREKLQTRSVSSRKQTKTNAERCAAYRQRLKEQDPERFNKLKHRNVKKMRAYRKKPKSEEQLAHERKLALARQKCYQERKKTAKLANPAKVQPRQGRVKGKEQGKNLKREANHRAVQKHRANQTEEQKNIVLQKRMERYYRQKAERKELQRLKTEKSN